MQVIVGFVLVGLVAGKAVETPVSPLWVDYHRDIGIPEAARIKAAEEAQDFDGARIAGGSAAGLGQFPYFGGLIITLDIGAISACGSSLLTNTRAVTAAHCWTGSVIQAVEYTVVLGSTLLFSGGTRVVTRDVEIHADYNLNTIYNDIAIIRLPWVDFNANIQPIAIATGNQDFVGASAAVAGFGLTYQGGSITSNQILSHVSMPVISNAECASIYGSFVIESTLCAATIGGRGICSSDSGGPLAVNNQLIGVVSWGSSCGQDWPGAFARVTYYADWLLARL